MKQICDQPHRSQILQLGEPVADDVRSRLRPGMHPCAPDGTHLGRPIRSFMPEPDLR